MTYYFSYSDDGEIIGKGQTNQSSSLNDGNFVVCDESQYNDHDKYSISVLDKSVILKPTSQVVAALKKAKKAEIKIHADGEYSNPVTDINGIVWNGGVSSASSIYMAIIAAENSNIKVIGLFDINNKEHLVSVGDAKYVSAQIMSQYSQILSRKQYFYSVIDSISENDADSITALDNIKW